MTTEQKLDAIQKINKVKDGVEKAIDILSVPLNEANMPSLRWFTNDKMNSVPLLSLDVANQVREQVLKEYQSTLQELIQQATELMK